MTTEKFYPSEENIGKDCLYWRGLQNRGQQGIGSYVVGCTFPKYEMEGRLSCEGIIDDVCLYLKDGCRPDSLTQEQIDELRHRIPGTNNRELPPGDIR